ncbi:heme-binding protein [Methyloglobulus sp.]|uniref:GlcG/HbpS family heme-binding protein n=1 Tax=Methyloglobulus sp. TaxID=2518622 RepID=UPI0032B75FB5
MKKTIKTSCAITAALLCISSSAFANNSGHGKPCDGLPNHDQLQTALKAARDADNGGFDLDMWASIVNRDGFVCAVAFSGADRNSQWPGSRIISAQKAYTANAFSLDGLVLSTANLYAATQPGGSLFGLQHSNPVATNRAYDGNPLRYGTDKDPMVGKKVGGVNVFGGGLALYANGKIIGAVGVSGDSSCADHNIAWRTRDTLGLDALPGGVGTPGDNIIFDLTNPFGHPTCNAVSQSANDAVIVDAPLN